MGTWGTGVFADDLAADIRGDWREAILDGMDPQAATQRLLDARRRSLDDSGVDDDESSTFWIALAAAQQQTGRLVPEIRDRALAEIASGRDVARFAAEDPRLARQRSKVLDDLATKLAGPPRAPTRMVRPKPYGSPLGIGDVVHLTDPESGRGALLMVIGTIEGYPPTSVWPVVAALLWRGGNLPDPADLTTLPFLLEEYDGPWAKTRPHAPVVSLFAIPSPPRGKRAMPPSANVIARGITRSDLPIFEKVQREGGPPFFYSSWHLEVGYVGSEQFQANLEWAVALHAKPSESQVRRLARKVTGRARPKT